MGQIVWTVRARQDLQDLVEYISKDSKTYAHAFALRLLEKVGRLSAFPESGAQIPEAPETGVRHLVVGAFRILYRAVDADGVVILTVVHGSRRVDVPEA